MSKGIETTLEKWIIKTPTQSPSERYQNEIRDFKLSQCEKAKECIRQETRSELLILKQKLTQDARPKLEKCCNELGIQDFNSAEFLGKFYKATESVLQDPSIPQNAKERFRYDVAANLEALFSVSKEDVIALRNRWTNPIEWAGSYASTDPKIYFVKILDARVASRIETAGLALKKAFSDGQIHPENGKYSYHPETYNLFIKGNPTEEIEGIPRVYGLQEIDSMMPWNSKISEKWLKKIILGGSEIDPVIKREIKIPPQDIAKISEIGLVEAFFDDLHKKGYKVLDESRIKELFQNGHPTSLSYRKNSPLSAITDTNGKVIKSVKDGSPLDAMSMLLKYSQALRLFQWRENEIREVRKDAWESEGLLDSTKRFIGKWDLLKSNFRHISLDLESKIDNAPIADIIVIGHGIMEILPYIGDAFTGKRAIGDLYYGIESDGKKTSKFIATIELIASALWLIGIGAAFTSLGKSERFMQIEKILTSIIKALPKRIRALENSWHAVNGPLMAIKKAMSIFSREDMGRKVAKTENKIQWMISESSTTKETIQQQKNVRRTLEQGRSADLPNAIQTNIRINKLAKTEKLSEDIIRKREAIRYIEETLKIPLSNKEKIIISNAIISAHNIRKDWEYLGKYGQKSLAEKMNILRSALEQCTLNISFKKKESMIKWIIKEWYAGTAEEGVKGLSTMKELTDALKKSGEKREFFEWADISTLYAVAQNPPIQDSMIFDVISTIGSLEGKSSKEISETLVWIWENLQSAENRENTLECLRAFFARTGDIHMDSMKKIIREMNPELRAKIEKTLQMLHIKVSERTTQEAIREKVGEILVKHPEDITRSLGETTHFLESLNIQAMDAEKSLAILGSLLEKIPAETLISNISSSRNAKLKTWIENAFPGMSWEKGEIPALLKIAEMSRGKTIAELRTADSPLARSHQAHYIKIVNASSNTETNSVHPLQLAYYTYAHDVFFRIQREISPGKALSEESRITLEKILGNKEFRSSKLEWLYKAIQGILDKAAS